MGTEPLKFLSEAKLAELARDVTANRNRYASGNFLDLSRDNGWEIETASVQVDHEALATLDGTARTAEADIANSLIVHSALKGMTPALAREERIWVRLTHVECLGYSKARWIDGIAEERFDAAVQLHLFAPGLTNIRDDNALSRLWWNMHIATIADPDDPEGALKLILKTADIRSNFVERAGTAARGPLARAVVRAMRNDPWITSTERAFREFMIALNRDGGGVLFEALSDAEADSVLAGCAARARRRLAKAA
jgi:hypothetical protein